MQYIIIGLGNFGTTLATKLTQAGHEVIGLDINIQKVEALKDQITHAIAMDTTNEQALKTLPLKTADAIIVGIGKNEGANILTTALLKKLGAQSLICRAVSSLHQTVLESMGITEIIHPENLAAVQLALKMEFSTAFEAFSLNDQFKIVEVEVPHSFVGQSIESIALPEKNNILILTIRRTKMQKNFLGIEKQTLEAIGMINKDTILREGDHFILFGKKKDIATFIKNAH